ncbi:hypothetical protein SAMN05660880_02375 [Luteibacter sp. 22Crub2.1]|nr:hypothetical protein SAMN05660880_02375 [Luteibacter sp. 22Crub2.1]
MEQGAGNYLTCVQFDVGTNTCTQTAWMPPPTLLPTLSVQDAAMLGGAIMTGLVAIWAAKLLDRAM